MKVTKVKAGLYRMGDYTIALDADPDSGTHRLWNVFHTPEVEYAKWEIEHDTLRSAVEWVHNRSEQ